MKNTLKFHTLWWMYHDYWRWVYTKEYPNYPTQRTVKKHPGHIHFWMMGFPVQTATKHQAYSGKQTYKFRLRDVWGPRSGDPNQQDNVRIVGAPKWYIYFEEYWRRVYIQQWENFDNPDTPGIINKKGIKYDCSLPQHSFGPFREGKDNFFFHTNAARGLPLEYWKNEKRVSRDHYLRYGDDVVTGKEYSWNFLSDYPEQIKTPAYGDNWIDCYEHKDPWVIPRNHTCLGDTNYGLDSKDEAYISFSDEDMARKSYADRMFLSPTLEYQKIVHLNWERPPGWNDRDLEDELDGESFGDAFAIELTSPFTKDGVIQSPFSNDNGIVHPPGNYFHGVVKEADKLRFRDDEYWDETETKPLTYHYPRQSEMGQPAYWNVPNSSWPLDGMWVEQCLGAFVQAKAKVIVEDRFGGRQVYWVNDTAFKVSTPFVGKDNGDEFPV